MAEEKKSSFENLYAMNINEKTDKRDNGMKELTYISWSWAWAEFKKLCPSVKYEVKMFNGLPYVYDEKTGYMVFTSVTVDDVTHDMWLPVMDSNNKAMKNAPYEYMTKKGVKKVVQSATMFDINKTIMRCLVKNLAMFGFGLYLYNGEDLPEEEKEEIKRENVRREVEIPMITEIQKKELIFLGYKGKIPLESLTMEQAKKYIKIGYEEREKKKGAKNENNI